MPEVRRKIYRGSPLRSAAASDPACACRPCRGRPCGTRQRDATGETSGKTRWPFSVRPRANTSRTDVNVAAGLRVLARKPADEFVVVGVSQETLPEEPSLGYQFMRFPVLDDTHRHLSERRSRELDSEPQVRWSRVVPYRVTDVSDRHFSRWHRVDVIRQREHNLMVS